MSIDLESQEVKDAIAAAVAEEAAGLKAKNTELLGKIKKLQQGQQIDPADVEALERERDDWKQKAGEAGKSLTKLTKDLDAATKRADAAEGYTSKLLVDNGLNDALVKAGVTNPAHQKAVKALLGGQAQVIADGDQKVVRIGDKALVDYVTEWAGTDEGKHFVTAPDTSGGGAGPSGPTHPNTNSADLSGGKAERLKAIAARFPELSQ